MAHRFPHGWTGADIVFLDCDSTLSTIEGIDELARRRGVDVAQLTADAMSGRVRLDSIYERRLELIAPGTADLVWLADRYAATEVPGARALVRALDALGIECHVISGGLAPAVVPFALSLGIRPERVHAVPYPTDHAAPAQVASAHPLARDGGKPEVVQSVCKGGPPVWRRMLAGDGASDLEAASAVGLFVGFGGVEDREPVRRAAPVFLRSAGLWGLGVLAAGPHRLTLLEDSAPDLYRRAESDLRSPELMVIQQS